MSSNAKARLGSSILYRYRMIMRAGAILLKQYFQHRLRVTLMQKEYM
uniref:Uncharacterized protein n=1 Tax=Myoviridae sp. ct0jJ30 TaxID=2825014 RepID=A0A8S5PJC4_9CAUD|nr:MAG TPA: hypothetical protein [Myoviridae sp. ct0jJ30]